MSTLRDILTHPARWRRSLGFGVHSPFAFRLITEIIPARDAYYAYDHLAKLAPDKRTFSQLALILRLICRFQPSRIITVGRMKHLNQTIVYADSRYAKKWYIDWPESDDTERVEGLHLPMVFIAEPTEKALDEIPAGDSIVVLLDTKTAPGRALWAKLLDNYPGVAFTTGRTGILCRLHHLHPATYNLI